jgi:hypothetical protein
VPDKIFKTKHKFRSYWAVLISGIVPPELHVWITQLVNHVADVTICSNIGDIYKGALKQGNQWGIAEPPGYKVGDGQWQNYGPWQKINSTKANTLYRIKPVNVWYQHLNHTPVTNLLLQSYTPKFQLYVQYIKRLFHWGTC